MNKTFCDRCGSEVEESANRDNFMRFGHIEGREILYPKAYDLCSDCITDLREWLMHPKTEVTKTNND